MCVGFGAVGDAGEIKESGGITGATDGDQSTGSKWGGGKHVMVRWWWGAGSQVGTDVYESAFEKTI